MCQHLQKRLLPRLEARQKFVVKMRELLPCSENILSMNDKPASLASPVEVLQLFPRSLPEWLPHPCKAHVLISDFFSLKVLRFSSTEWSSLDST